VGLIFLLDDDSYVKPGAIKKVLESYEKLCETSMQQGILSRAAVIKITENIKKLSKFKEYLVILPHHLIAFFGTFIKANVLRGKRIKIRKGFFLDQVDFDFFYKLKNLDS
jgi:hypothetical protein